MIEQLFDFLSPADSRSPGDQVSQPQRPLVRTSDLTEMAKPVEELILKYPAAALASAFLVGVVVAWWIKRK